MALIERSRLPRRNGRLADIVHGVAFALAAGFMAAIVLGFVH